MRKKNKDIIKLWEPSGMLEGLNEIEKKYCAKLLDEGRLILLKSKSETKYDVMYFPVIRRVYDELLKKYDPKESYRKVNLKDLKKQMKKFHKILAEFLEFVDDFSFYSRFDFEAEFAVMFSRKYLRTQYSIG